MKVMISQPMGGKSKEEIAHTKELATAMLKAQGYEVVDTWFSIDEAFLEEAGMKNIPLAYLAASLGEMSKVDAVFFCAGWSAARGCKIEHLAAEEYGLKILYTEDANED